MQITREMMTSKALGFIKEGESYDRTDVAYDVASDFIHDFENEFGSVAPNNRDGMKQAIFEKAQSGIDWARVNRKAHPDDYADMMWRWESEKEPKGMGDFV